MLKIAFKREFSINSHTHFEFPFIFAQRGRERSYFSLSNDYCKDGTINHRHHMGNITVAEREKNIGIV